MGNKSIVEWKHIVRPGADECHVRDYSMNGGDLLKLVIDTAACFTSVREDTGGMMPYICGNFHKPVWAMDELVITVRLEREGNTSRTYSFTVERTIAYANDGTATAKVLEKPELCIDGTLVMVCKPH